MNKFQNIASRITSMDINYPSCDDVYSEFIMYCDFDKTNLNLKPDKKYKLGDVFIGKNGKEITFPKSLWSITSNKKINSKDARDHLDYIIDFIYPEKDKILYLQRYYQMHIKCVWFAAGISGGPVLWPEQMSSISELNLELSFSFYPSEW